ncbi:MAG: hypothetical protein Q4G52_11665, partial [Clostridia bacterium]|nr:hypothetical protein [Clostridia bacterium]
MRIAVETALPQFANDIADVVRLFYGEGAAVTAGETHDAELRHAHTLEADVWRESAVLSCGGQSICYALSAADEVLFRKKSPYPKTYHPLYEAMLAEQLRTILKHPDSPLRWICDPQKVERF